MRQRCFEQSRKKGLLSVVIVDVYQAGYNPVGIGDNACLLSCELVSVSLKAERCRSLGQRILTLELVAMFFPPEMSANRRKITQWFHPNEVFISYGAFSFSLHV